MASAQVTWASSVSRNECAGSVLSDTAAGQLTTEAGVQVVGHMTMAFAVPESMYRQLARLVLLLWKDCER